MFTKVSTTIPIKMNHHQVSIGMLYSEFPLTAVALSRIPSQFQNHFYRREGPEHLEKINQN